MVHPLKKLIVKQKLNINQFVREYNLDYTPEYINYLIKGQRNPSKKAAKSISQATGIPAEVLMFPENYN